MEYLGLGGFELAAKLVMLRLRGGELRGMKETQLPPAIRIARLVPPRCARRAYEYAL